MSLVIPLGGWVNLSGDIEIRGMGVVKKIESPDFRSSVVGIPSL